MGLLHTYESGRKPHVRTVVANAKALGQIVGELDLDLARVQDVKLRGQLERGEGPVSRQGYIPDLASGVMDRGHAGGTLFVQPHVAGEFAATSFSTICCGADFFWLLRRPSRKAGSITVLLQRGTALEANG